MDLSHKWKLSLFFSLVSYSILLFGIIVLDVFWRRDFSMEVAIITGGYMGGVLLLLSIGFMVFRSKLEKKRCE